MFVTLCMLIIIIYIFSIMFTQLLSGTEVRHTSSSAGSLLYTPLECECVYIYIYIYMCVRVSVLVSGFLLDLQSFSTSLPIAVLQVSGSISGDVIDCFASPSNFR